jgi:hypothetical protein
VQPAIGGIDIVVLELPTLAVHERRDDYANWIALGPPSSGSKLQLPHSHFPTAAKQILWSAVLSDRQALAMLAFARSDVAPTWGG